MTRRTDAEIIKPKGVGVSSPIPNTVEVIGPHRREGGQLRDNNLQFLSLTSYSVYRQHGGLQDPCSPVCIAHAIQTFESLATSIA